jgi:hypothetical protein
MAVQTLRAVTEAYMQDFETPFYGLCKCLFYRLRKIRKIVVTRPGKTDLFFSFSVWQCLHLPTSDRAKSQVFSGFRTLKSTLIYPHIKTAHRREIEKD